MTALAKKVTVGEGRTLCNDFVREFCILNKLSRSTKPRDRLIGLVGVEIIKDVAGVWRTALFTPLFENGNLDTYLRHIGNNLLKKDLQVMVRDILLILEQLRASQIIHRDIKAGNIVVSKNHRLILIDFGSAVEFKHKMAMTGRVLTTPHVRAPEIVCGLHFYSYPVDVYAAGCIVWSIFTGGETMLPNLRSSILRTKTDQVKFHIGELRSVMGTEVRVTKNMGIARRFGKLFHEVRS